MAIFDNEANGRHTGLTCGVFLKQNSFAIAFQAKIFQRKHLYTMQVMCKIKFISNLKSYQCYAHALSISWLKCYKSSSLDILKKDARGKGY